MAEKTTILLSLTITDSAVQLLFCHQGLFIWRLHTTGMYNMVHSHGSGYTQVINQCLSSPQYDFHMDWTSESIAHEFIDSESGSCQTSCLGLRSPRTSLLLHFIGQRQSKQQLRLKRMENKLHLLIACTCLYKKRDGQNVKRMTIASIDKFVEQLELSYILVGM